ncbi:MAG: hypothetical protein ACI3ZB_11220 [Prevotella sp.]
MKRTVFTIIVALMASYGFGQIQRKTIFDFTQPLKLTPAVTPAKEDKSAINVADSVFTKGSVKISFTKGVGIGPTIQTFIDQELNKTTYALRIYMQEGLVISVPKSSEIEKVEFTGNSLVGDLRVVDETIGRDSLGYKIWMNNHVKKVDTLTYKLSSSPSQLNKIEITYTVPSAVLIPKLSMEDSAVVQVFDSLNLTFPSEIIIKDASEIYISDSKTVVPLAVSVKDSTVTLKPAAPITTDGTYTIIVPEKSFVDKYGYENKAIKLTFVVKPAFNFVSIDPAPGVLQKLPLIIKANYGKGNKIGDIDKTQNVRLYKNGEPFRRVELTISPEEDSVVVFNINDDKEFVEKGTYELKVPAATIYNNWKGDTELEKSNPDLNLVYTIDEPQYVKEAKLLLSNEGVGYPIKESSSYAALEALLNDDNIPTEAEVDAALANYYTEKSIAMPAVGKWYQVAAVNAEGEEIYLASDGDKALFVKDAQFATAFEVVDSSSVFQMRNIEDKYLTTQGVSSDKDTDASKLVLSKLDAANLILDEGASVDAAEILALFTINGKYITGDFELDVCAQVNFTDSIFNTNPSNKNAFMAGLTSAFRFVEVEKPAPVIATDSIAYTLYPTVVESSADSLTITLTGATNVRLAKNAAPYFTDKAGKEIESAMPVLVAVENVSNAFRISLRGLSEDDYQIVLPEGTFIYTKDDKDVKTQEIREKFSIGKSGSADDNGINFVYNKFQVFPTTTEAIKDVELNNILIKEAFYYNGLVANPKVQVRLAISDTNETVRVGHLQEYDDSKNDPGVITLKVIFDKEIKEGELATDHYGLVLEKGCLGDYNYGMYLNDKTSVNPSDCKANDRFVVPFYVNNAIANGISESPVLNDMANKIFNIYGVRIEKITAPGIYIINGKKVYVENVRK